VRADAAAQEPHAESDAQPQKNTQRTGSNNDWLDNVNHTESKHPNDVPVVHNIEHSPATDFRLMESYWFHGSTGGN